MCQVCSNTTEIFNIKEHKWIPGPTLPERFGKFPISYDYKKFVPRGSAYVSLPSTMKFTCLVIGGEDLEMRNDVWGLNKSLTSWTNLGKIRGFRSGHIALPLS